MFELSKKIKALPPYLFLDIDRAKRKAEEEGRDIIDLGVGDPDQPTPGHIIEKLYQAAKDPRTHRYALDQGMPVLRESISKWYKQRFAVCLDPETEILPLIGSKEGIAHFPLAFINEGDYSLVPDPGYPPYKGASILAGAKPYLLGLKEENDYLPELKKIPLNIRKKAKIMFINYPNNPTAATCEIDFYKEVAEFAAKNKIIVVSDLAYSEITYDGYKPPSFLQAQGAKDIGIEFHSLSKTYNMAGWRLGWACGNRDLISALSKVKSNIDSGIFSAIQMAGVAALESGGDHIAYMSGIYRQRRDCLLRGIASLGLNARQPKATFYAWVKVPDSYDSISFARRLLEKADVVVAAGVGFGRYGEGFVRMALTVPEQRIAEAVERFKKVV